MPRNPGAPSVFISSTSDDLKEYRKAAERAASRAGFLPITMEDFPATGHPPLDVCRAKVTEADVLVAIVAHRYGWVPPDQPANHFKSITWLECEEAARQGKEVLAFLVDPAVEWPLDQREAYRITAAIEKGNATADLFTEVQRNVAQLDAFKKWIDGHGVRATFRNPDDLRGNVEGSLREWRDRRPEFGPAVALEPNADPAKYLDYLREQTGWIDIRGLQVGTGKAYRFPIEDLYIPLTSARSAEAAGEVAEREPMELEFALSRRRLVIVGDPGSGKTTFLRRVAFALCATADTPAAPDDAATGFLPRLTEVFHGAAPAVPGPPFPLLIRIADLAEHIRICRQAPSQGAPTTEESPAWLVHFLKTKSEDFHWDLDAGFFERKLSDGSAILLLDGLDETPRTTDRESIARLFEHATQAYRQCRFVVTTRPLAYTGRSVLAKFGTAQIEPLGREAIRKFLEHWCRGLFPESARTADLHLAELAEALRSRAEIRRMARNPVMLTALAVVHWNERRLPEQRADLYESVLNWLARSREKREGREPAERCLAVLQQLALAMQKQPEGRVLQVSKGRAADMLAPQFDAVPKSRRHRMAQEFVEQEEVDSGIVVSRGSETRFWHLTFQEYLAARAIAGLAEKVQQDLLLTADRIYKPEWREVALLLGGVLHKQGKDKVDGLVSALLEGMGERPSLAEQARCAGLLGAMVRDLRPFNYQPADPRYQRTMEAVLGIFDADKANAIEPLVRLGAAEALGQAGDPRLRQDNWITIAGGGPTPLKPFQIGRYPVTVEEYRRFVDDEGYQNGRWWQAGGFGKSKEPNEWEEQVLHPNRPVTNVSWNETAAYCAWAGTRLPSEAEWERAARGFEGRVYPWGRERPDEDRATLDANVQVPTPVGLYPAGATPEGIADMAGNVWEWVEDWDKKYEVRVLRGWSFRGDPRRPPGAGRLRYAPSYRHDNFGFRCARDVAP
jgi:hypothetical protein